MTSTAINITDFRTQIPGKLIDEYTWGFPTVESNNSSGKKMYWKIKVRVAKTTSNDKKLVEENLDGNFYKIVDAFYESSSVIENAYGWISVDSGHVGGKNRDVIPTIVKSGKNIGKANATNVFTQALRDALGLYMKQLNKAVLGAEKNVGVTCYPPMLATLLRDVKNVKYKNAFVQRKYDGVRAVATYDPAASKDAFGNPIGGVILYSRTKRPYVGFDYIKEELIHALSDLYEAGTHVYLDGEIYKHGMLLQDISGYARREDKSTDVKVDYMVYDMFIPSKPELKYSERKQILENIFEEHGPFNNIKLVETFKIDTAEDANNLYNQFLSEKYEGAMLRIDSPYRYSEKGYRSKNLLKMKPELDAEFTIIGYETGTKGKAASAIMFICETDSKIQFNVTPAMELSERTELAKKMLTLVTVDGITMTYFDANYKGKKLIVYFDEWSRDKVPQRARTKGVIRTWD
jgi:ATP-dependent DNA ligase